METGTDMHLDGDGLCDYAEGILDAPARAAAEAHLLGCAQCRRELQAVRGYFREMSGLEPVQAPAHFLAQVRARLPRPSPWKTALAVFLRPRFIPLQIAFLTLLGITTLSVYLQQRGGLADAPVLVEPAAPPSRTARTPEAFREEVMERALEEKEAQKRVSPGVGDDAPVPAPSRKRAAGHEPLTKRQEPPLVAETKAQDALRQDAGPPPPRQDFGRRGASEGGEPAGNAAEVQVAGAVKAETPSTASPAPSSPAREPTAGPKLGKSRPLSSGQLTDIEVMGFLDLADIQKPQAGSDLPGNSAALADQAQADRLSAAGRVDGVEPEKKAKAGPRPTLSPPPRMEFTVRLRNAKDTAAILSGLKSMGADVEAPQPTNPLRYVVQVPETMLPELRRYLERYGQTEPGEPSPPAPVFFLRLILP